MQGTQLGSYIIEEKIGEGGMGVVYRATHTRMNRSVVIKMLHAKYAADPHIAKRFKNEAIAAARIGHPGIVQVFDIDNSDGSLYIVMELLPGESLQARMNTVRQMPVDDAINIVRLAASALSAAHAEAIVHRDLKPDNIFLVPDPEVRGGERVKLLDFGVAKLMGDGATSVATRTGAMMGTPLYMSPEQCRGAGGVDARTDLYALGIILFQMLAGRPPFTGAGVGDYIVAHMSQAPPSILDVRPDVGSDVAEIIGVLLAKDPNERFASADALVKALANCSTDARAATARADSATPAAEMRSDAGFDTTMASVDPPPAGPIVATTLGAAASERGIPIAEDQPRSRGRMYAVIGVAVLAIGTAGVFMLNRGGGDNTASNTTTTSDAATTSPGPADAGPTNASVDAATKVASNKPDVAKPKPRPTTTKPKPKPRKPRTKPKPRKPKETKLERQKRAHAVYKKGSAAFKRRDYAAALRFNKQAYAINKDPFFVFNMAQALRYLGRDREALRHYERFLRIRKNSKIHPQVRRTVRQLRRKLGIKAPGTGRPPPPPY